MYSDSGFPAYPAWVSMTPLAVLLPGAVEHLSSAELRHGGKVNCPLCGVGSLGDWVTVPVVAVIIM